MSKENEGIQLNSCEAAKGPRGRKLLAEIATVANCRVTGWDDWYAIVPHGYKWEAEPGKFPKQIEYTGRKYEGRWAEDLKEFWDSVRW